MKGATEELFVTITYYKKRESLECPQWHFTVHISPMVFRTGFQKLRFPQLFGYFWMSRNGKKPTQLIQNIFRMRTKVLYVIMQWL